MKTKTMTIVSLFLFASAAAFAGGQGEATTLQEDVQVSPAGTFPIVEQEVTVQAFLNGTRLVDNFQDNDFTDYLEEKTNVILDLDVAPAGTDADQKVNVMLASGDYPELFINTGFSKAQQLLYGQQGVFLALNDLIAEYGVNTKRAFEEFPLVEDNFTLPDGNIYALPDINDCFHCNMSQKMWIYEPWLEKLGLEMPTTTAEFKEVLIAFRDEDPNGNGKRDEIPFAGAIQGWHAGIDGFIMNSFIYTHGNLAEGPGADRLRVVDGRVDAVYDSEEWKAGLTYLNDLYTEDLIAPDSFVQDMNQYKQLGENPETVILGAATGGHMGVFAEFQGESGRWLDYTSVAPLEGPEGVRYARYNPVYGAPQWTITNRADHPSVAFRLGDAFYEDDVMLRNIYGLEGVHWRRAEPGELGINGKQGIWYKIVGRGQIDRTTWWNQAGPQLRSRDFRLGEVPAGPNNLAVILYDETKANYEPYTPDPRVIVPPLSFDSDIAAEYVELQTTINDYVTEMIARFITGDADVNARWEEYLDELDKIGLDRYLQITQDAYEKTQ